MVNLQIVIQKDGIAMTLFSETYAQHMDLEGGNFDCLDEEKGWFKSLIPCDGLIVTPDETYAECSWCHERFSTSEIWDHEYICPERERQSQDPWANDDEDNSNGGGGSSGGGSGGGSYSGDGNNSYYGGDYSSVSTSWSKFYNPAIDYDLAEAYWGKYEVGNNYKVCVYFLPQIVPKQITTQDCFTTSLANKELLNKPDMHQNDYSKIRESYVDLFEEEFDASIYDDGISIDLLKNNASLFGLESINLLTVSSLIESGEEVMGIIKWQDGACYHAVLVIGYDRNNFSSLLCMDPWSDNSTKGKYTYYNSTLFKYFYKFK